MKRLLVKNFNLEHTVESGQIFRYEKKGEFYFICIDDFVIKIKQENKGGKEYILYTASKKVSEEKIKKFFGLDEDLNKILIGIDKDKFINKAIASYPGLRIIKQDPKECLVSFIASAFSNIPKIKKSLNCLCREFGNEIIFEGHKFYTFPKLNKINDLNKLKKCSLGFRAQRIYELKNLDEKFFKELEKLNYEKAKQKLMELKGVGSKVADCVLLFSLCRYEAFPTDVWIERLIKNHYFSSSKSRKNAKINARSVEEFGKNYFGKYAGYAQQYIYHYGRNLKK